MTDKPNVRTLKTSSLNPRASTWTSSEGVVLTLRPISWFAAERIMNDPKGRPEIPQTPVVYAGTQAGTESNPNDPAYVEKLADWKRDNQYRAFLYAFSQGVEITVPGDFAKSNKEWFPQAGDAEIKALYIMSLISVEEFPQLFDKLMGRTGPTDGGVAEAVESFRG
jgi:hypothetical protein